MGKTKTLFLSICLLFVGLTVSNAYPVNQDFCKSPGIVQATIVQEVPAISFADKVAIVYTSQIGVQELTGMNDGPAVDTYLAVTGLDNRSYFKQNRKGYEWCAAFVSWCFVKAEVKAIKNAWAPSWFTDNHTIYTRGNPKNLIPERADVFGLWYDKNKLIGHVGFIDEWPNEGEYLITVEGNWGGQVLRHRRIKSNIYKVSRWV